MILKQKQNEYDDGAYGRVFFDKDTNTAIKVFKRMLNKDEHVANVFESEVNAYNLVQNSSKLKKITPTFLGEMTIDAIYSLDGEDISESFYLDKAYKMAYLDGRFIKLGEVGMSKDEMENLVTSFNDIGINYIKDSSVIINEDNKIKYIIDFAIEEFESWW